MIAPLFSGLATLPLSLSPALPPGGGAPVFSQPVRLLAAGQPLNFVEEMPYPSPVLCDIDRDGARELVCGDLWGYLWVYEDQGVPGDVQWGAANKLQVNGKDLKVPNW